MKPDAEPFIITFYEFVDIIVEKVTLYRNFINYLIPALEINA